MMGFVNFYLVFLGLLKDRDDIESWEVLKSKMQEDIDEFIPKQSAFRATTKPI